MRVTFWGTRGSFAKPGPGTVRYGGNTSCVQVESSSGTIVLLDCGTGAHALGQSLVAGHKAPLRGHILISHTHWDHIQGLPFFNPLFVPGNEWDIYGPRGMRESLRETLAGQMQYAYFPVTLDAMAARVRFHGLLEGTFQVGDVRVRARYLNHPALTLGYRLEADGVAVVYACDHEPHARELAVGEGMIVGQDRAHADFLRGADLVIHDAQYTAAEYPNKIGWGHGTPEYAIEVCRVAGVERLALTHHDPLHDDDAMDGIMDTVLARLRADGSAMDVFAAAEGQVLELRADPGSPVEGPEPEAPALWAVSEAQARQVLLGMADSPETEPIRAAAFADGLDLTRVTGAEELLPQYVEMRPSLVILDGEADGLTVCRSIRDVGDRHARDVPVILVASVAGSDETVSDWLLKPFSTEYVRSRMRAWLFRVACRWVRAPLPEDELERLAALRELDLLDTAPEDRFDRITRLAAALFGVPMAWVTLLDADRQWFKSRVGLAEAGSPRDQSFCAHAILSPEPLIVRDTFLDDRFADNPLVTGPPHLRFYAGCPVTLDDGHRVGTLCVGDVRPRDLSPDEVERLRDLADLVEAELAARARLLTPD